MRAVVCWTVEVGKMNKRVLGLLCLLSLWSCGEATDTTEPIVLTEPDPEPDPTPQVLEHCAGDSDEGFAGTLYVDKDISSTTMYSQVINEGDTPLEGALVKLLRKDEEQLRRSCADGSFRFQEATPGWHMLEVADPAPKLVTSSNQTRRLPYAVRNGAVKIVTFGDSIPAYGPQPWFPQRLGTKLKEVVDDVNVENIAVPGTTTVEWLPGTLNYQNLLSKFEGADVIVFSLGGNDLYAFAGRDLSNTPVDVLLKDFEAAIEGIKSNLKNIVTELRKSNPTADIVWLLYPNYARSTEWKMLAGSSVKLVERILQRTLGEIREDMAHHEGLMIWDMYGGTQDVDLDTILIDPLHLNETGHELYANALMETLGGVLIGDQNASQTRNIGVSLEP